jgi:hypothetical protein
MRQPYLIRITFLNDGRHFHFYGADPAGNDIYESFGRNQLFELPDSLLTLAEMVEHDRATSEQADELGERLFGLLLPDSVGLYVQTLLAEVANTEQSTASSIRFELNFVAADVPAIAELPWELLRLPSTPSHSGLLLTDLSHVMLIRTQQPWLEAQPARPEPQLRVQIVGFAATEVDRSEQLVERMSLELASDPGIFAAPMLHNPSIEELNAALQLYRPHVLHILGYGRLRRNAQGTIFSELAVGSHTPLPVWMRARELGAIFLASGVLATVWQPTTQVPLHGTRPLIDLATQVAGEGMAVTLALKRPLPEVESVEFARIFYLELSRGAAIQSALKAAIRGIEGDPGALITLMRVESGQIFVPSEQRERVPPSRSKPEPQSTPALANEADPSVVSLINQEPTDRLDGEGEPKSDHATSQPTIAHTPPSQEKLQALLGRLSPAARSTIERALGEAVRLGRFWLGLEFFLMSLSRNKDTMLYKMLKDMLIDANDFRGLLRDAAGIAESQRDWRTVDVAVAGAEVFANLVVFDPQAVNTDPADPRIVVTPRMMAVLEEAARLASDQTIDLAEIFQAILKHPTAVPVAQLFAYAARAGWDCYEVCARLAQLLDVDPQQIPMPTFLTISEDEPSPLGTERGSLTPGDFPEWDILPALELSKFQAPSWEGADLALIRALHVILEKQSTHPLLVGKQGVGKKSLIVEIVRRLRLPEHSLNIPHGRQQFLVIPTAALIAANPKPGLSGRHLPLLDEVLVTLASGRQDKTAPDNLDQDSFLILCDKLKHMLQLALHDPSIIFVIDGLDLLLSENLHPKAQEVVALLRQEMNTAGIRCLCTTTVEGYRQTIEHDRLFASCFEEIWLNEPGLIETSRIVQKISNQYTNVHFKVDHIRDIIRISQRYLPHLGFPGKAIAVLEQVATEVSAQSAAGQPTEVSSEWIVKAIASMKGIGVEQIRGSTIPFEQALMTQIEGQDDAIRALIAALPSDPTHETLADRRRPRHILLLAGSDPITQMNFAQVLALTLSDTASNTVQRRLWLDMTNFINDQSAAWLVGASTDPGMADKNLTFYLSQMPYGSVVVETIERALPGVLALLLQLFETGFLVDSRGNLIDGRHASVILLCGAQIADSSLHGEGDQHQASIRTWLKERFHAELLDHIDHIIHLKKQTGEFE